MNMKPASVPISSETTTALRKNKPPMSPLTTNTPCTRGAYSGTQALVQLPLMQRQRDLEAGRNTAGYISGYRGSPLGNYDSDASG
jgi:hypothetical protein